MIVPKKNTQTAGKEIRERHTGSSGIFFEVKKHIYSGTSCYQKIDVIENDTFGRVLLLDGLVQTTERDEFFYHEMLVHPALLAHPSPENILIIGGGDGGALREVLRYPIQKALLVEIDGQVIQVCRDFFPWLTPALSDTRTKLLLQDGYRFIQESEDTFDVILVDSSDPVGPSACLHERDFYEKLKKRLRPSGVIAAQSGSLLYHLEEMRKKRKFLHDLFRFVRFYLSPVPTYPGGTWCYVFLSERVDPLIKKKKKLPSGLKYFNRNIHRAAFALPNLLLEDPSV